MWTRFYDIKGGKDGRELKVGYEHIYVELPHEQALQWFKVRFARDPKDGMSWYDGPDFGTVEHDSLDGAVKFDIPATYSTQAQWSHLSRSDVLLVYETEALKDLRADSSDRVQYAAPDPFMDQLKALEHRLSITERKFDERMSELKMRISNSIDYLQDGMDTAAQASAAITKLDIMYPQLVSEELRRQGWVLRGRKDVYQDTINELNELLVQLNGDDEDVPF